MNFFEKINYRAEKDEVKKRIAGGVIINNNNEVLFLKRKSDDFMGGILELPSGNIEEGESIEEGLLREIKEETNLLVSSIGMFINSFDYLSSSGKKSRQFNFEVNVTDFDNIFLTEHDDYKWIKLGSVENEKDITDEVKYTIEILKYNKNMN